MERLILGGFSYSEAFPFSEVAEKRREKLLEELARVLSAEALSITSKILDEKGYDHYLKAVGIAEKRFLFYKNILESEELRKKYLIKLGTEDITWRIVFAMHGCIEHANKILCHMDNLIGDLIPDSISVMEMGYSRWEIQNLNEPITKCIMTGVCICERGDKEPYTDTDSCVMDDPTRIIISKSERQKRDEHFYKSYVKMIKKDK
ncbi:MAG: hypothetical protein KGJ58_01465 [Patescibacteria group bacterium]|nr:hypothetical protein [Patescibacteria group bacterium]MDE2218106.1 hypothetical protein [Patescibacteria group bacterium]